MSSEDDVLDLQWISPGRLAAFPQWALHDLDALERAGIGAIVSLTEHRPRQLLGETRFRLLHLPVVDMTAPATGQIREFVDFVRQAHNDGLAVGVHCMAGLGRTGTMIACWLVSEGMTPDEAIEHVRRIRPGSVENEVQERAVHRWALISSGRWQSGEFL